MAQRLLIRAAAVADHRGARGPAAVLLEGRRVVAAGPPSRLGRPDAARTVDLPRAVLLPGLVNAHCHLDLSHLPPEPPAADFTEWIEGVRTRRLRGGEAVAAAVRRGSELALAGGTAMVGDIAGNASVVPARELRAAGLAGVSFLEVIGAGSRQPGALRDLEAVRRAADGPASALRIGVSPHAPYTCGPAVYRRAAALGLPLATHLAETPQELRLFSAGDGPLADLLRRHGMLDGRDGTAGAHPIDLLADVLRAARVVAAHVNYFEPRHLEHLAVTGTTVAYCPRASAYFGHRRDDRGPEAPPHGYLEMRAAGVNVALGTDALPCLDTPQRISVLDEMRLLHRRDGTDPAALLRMATVAGAAGLGADPGLVTFDPGPVLGALALDVGAAAEPAEALRLALRGDAGPRWIVPPAREAVPAAGG